MNNSADAREHFKKTVKELGFSDSKPNQMTNSDYWLCTITAMESYHQFAREKELSELTDEVIEGIVYNHCDGTWRKPDGVEVADEVDVKAVVKAIRNHLKQNTPQLPPDRSTKGQEG